jgi:hypothetical protein
MEFPGHRNTGPPIRAGTAVEIREIDGRRATDLDGAAELLDRSRQTVALLSSPKKRAEVGWPKPLRRLGGKNWYAVADLEHFRDTYQPRIVKANLARVHHVTLDGDPNELIPAVEFRRLIDAPDSTWIKYVDISKTAWDRGEDGYLPRPDHQEPARHGVTRYWKRHRVETWISNRPGKQPAPGRPKGGGNPRTNTTTKPARARAGKSPTANNPDATATTTATGKNATGKRSSADG